VLELSKNIPDYLVETGLLTDSFEGTEVREGFARELDRGKDLA
jgi:hypothetical protein